MAQRIEGAEGRTFFPSLRQGWQEGEIDFLQKAAGLCPNVLCVLTKTDFYPSWRKIRDLNVGHLARAGVTADILCVSSSLRVHALRANDRELNRESGFPELANYLQNKIAANAEKLSVRQPAVSGVTMMRSCPSS